MRRVVITGIGLVTPLAGNREASWTRLIEGKSGAQKIDLFDTEDLPCKIAAQVPWTTGRGGGEGDPEAFNPDVVGSAKERRRISDFITYGMGAAAEAIEDSGWKPETDGDRDMTGVLIGSGIGGLPEIAETTLIMEASGPRKVSPFFIPSALINLASGQVSIKYGFRGPNHSVVTACATGAHAIGDSARLIQYGDADVMVAGGAEGALCKLAIAGFASAKTLSTNFNDEPEKASRPYDKDRDGFLFGEGAGVLVLEEYEHAKARGAKIYAEVLGYGLTGDAHHITSPPEDGNGGYRAMQTALKRANLTPADIDYVNTHGTSTPVGDEIEVRAIERLFGDSVEGLSLSSTKSSIGHLLGAAGAVEGAFTALAINRGMIPPTLNLHNPSFESAIDLTPLEAKAKSIKYALSNSFGFGGTNAALVMGRVDD